MLWYLIAIGMSCMLLERLRPGWNLPAARTWPVRVVAVNLVQVGVVLLAGMSWERWLSAYSVLHLSRALPPWAGGVLAYFIATFVFYWWHRWRHESDLLWRLFHQIHHSPRRIEVITSFYKHPGEMVVNSLIGSALVYALLGLSPEAGAVYTACTALGEFFYHTNVRTPQWVGWFFQQPRDAPHPPRARTASRQLRRYRVVGHALRHVPEPAAIRGRLRIRCGEGGKARGDARVYRRAQGLTLSPALSQERGRLYAVG